MTPHTLTGIENALRASWAADTCSPDDLERAGWSADNPAWGHCDITALVVHDLLGGELVVGEVHLAGEPQGFHWWNRLPGGFEVDLTREQFRVGQTVTAGRTVQRPAGRTRRRWEEYELLRDRVAARLPDLLPEPSVDEAGRAAPGTSEPDRRPVATGGPGGPDPRTIDAREPERRAFDAGGHRLSYLDFGGPGRPLLALHGHFCEGRTFTALAAALAPDWRVIALDQRGHGRSDRTPGYDRDGYVRDAAALLEHLGLDGVVVLGHSLGGVNAYQLAARHPHLVRALVIEDVGAVVADDLSFCLSWPRRAPTRAALVEALGDSVRYLADAIREHPDGWGLAFEPQDMVTSHGQVRGDHWDDWLASDCPTLLVHGTHSDVLGAEQAAAMTAHRKHTRLVSLPTGHTVHDTAPADFATAVREFLARLP
ncbi:alpha/beta hydrolase [Streptomyces kurssanovii]|uniref:Alpha/beta hydrolase n=1 Tax=Streptomyces kurssanovii TaxID=67312 RepID=A0ABV3I0S5_9ACTN